MLRLLYICIIALTISCNEDIKNDCMTISDANPIQFWPVGKLSFNEKSPAYIEEGYCFNQKFKCLDQVRTQFLSDQAGGFSLVAVDCDNDDELFIENMGVSSYGKNLIDDSFQVNINGFTQENYPATTGQDWIWDTGRARTEVSHIGGVIVNSKVALYDADIEIGKNISLSLDFSIDDNGISSKVVTLSMVFYKTGSPVQTIEVYSHTGANTGFLVPIRNSIITPTVEADQVGFIIANASSINNSNFVYLDNISLKVFQTLVHDNVFTAYDNLACEKSVKFNLAGNILPTIFSDGFQTFDWVGGLAWEKKDFYVQVGLTAVNVYSQVLKANIENAPLVPGNYRVKVILNLPYVSGNTYLVRLRLFDTSDDGSTVVQLATGLADGYHVIDDYFDLPTVESFALALEVGFSSGANTAVVKVYDFKVFSNVAHSDCVNFTDQLVDGPGNGSILIKYKSIQNFADLIYTPSSEYFSLRLQARFFHERQISANKSFTTTERILNTASSLKSQRKLSIDDVPAYMHRKIQLALAHSTSGSLLIDEVEWTIEENYELGSRPESYPMYPAEIWLTEKEFYKHNVI